jgi:hypothetical protein
MSAHHSRLQTLWLCAALQCAALTSWAQKSVTILTDRQVYTTKQAIIVTAINGLDKPIVTFDEKSYCSNFYLERQTDLGWQAVAGCPLARVSLPTVIKAHTEYRQTLPVEAYVSGPREPGVYRIEFDYYLADEDGYPIGDDYKVYSDLFKITGTVALSGKILLMGCVNPAQPITFSFRPEDGSDPFQRTKTLSDAGEFALYEIPVGRYRVAVKGSKWLQRVVRVDLTGGSVADLDLRLRPGDVNGDNTVDIFDLGLLADTFHADPNSQNWNPNADLNCDDRVDILDLGLLADNFGLSGDP